MGRGGKGKGTQLTPWVCLLLFLSLRSFSEADQCSKQPMHYVYSESSENRQNASALAEECAGDRDYHTFSTESYKVRSGWIREMSGLARSGLENDIFWGHNDGKVNSIFAVRLGTDETRRNYAHRHQLGDVITRAHLPSKVERQTDWEDIDNGLCPDDTGRSCLWIADTGDNSKRRNRPRIHVVVEPDLDMKHHSAGSGEFYDIHICKEDLWTFQFEFEYEEDGAWIEGGSFDIEAMVVSPDGDKVWMFEKRQHWEKNIHGWPRVFESDNIREALQDAGKDRFIQIKLREITKIPRACEKAPEAWEWLSKPENDLFGRKIIEDEVIATTVYKYKKMHEYGHREGLIDLFMNGTDCTSFPPIFWMITGANLHPSGKRLAIQTYSGAFEYVFSEPMNFKELKDLKPRQLALPRFDQVESIVYSHDGKSLFAIPEAKGRKGWQKVQQITCRKKVGVTKEEATEGAKEEAEVEDDAIAIRSVVESVKDEPRKEANASETRNSFLSGMQKALQLLESSDTIKKSLMAGAEDKSKPGLSWGPVLSGGVKGDMDEVTANGLEEAGEWHRRSGTPDQKLSSFLDHFARSIDTSEPNSEELLVAPDRIKGGTLILDTGK